jgi:hypothetical protein
MTANGLQVQVSISHQGIITEQINNKDTFKNSSYILQEQINNYDDKLRKHAQNQEKINYFISYNPDLSEVAAS